MENAPRLATFTKASVFNDFLSVLDKNGYFPDYEVVSCPDYGIPQNRKRLVLLASKCGTTVKIRDSAGVERAAPLFLCLRIK